MKFLKNFLNNINWTGTLCRRAGLTMAALLIFLVALSSRAPKSSADKDDSSSKTVQESSSQQEIKIDTTYVKVNNDELKNMGLIALDNKDHSYTPDTSGFESIYSYLFNAKGDMVMTTGSTSICGNKEMLEHLNAMVSDFAAQTGLKTIMVRNAAYRVDDKVYKETVYEYGAAITPEPKPEGDYATFEWKDLPQTMPAHDVVVYASYTSGIAEILMNTQRSIRIYSTDGEKLDKPQKGLNIVIFDDGTIKKIVVK